MKATIALLTDRETFHRITEEAWAIHQKYRTGLAARRLLPHVSLKQPFDLDSPDDLPALVAYAAELAASVEPFEITLSGYGMWELPEGDQVSGILYQEVTDAEDQIRSLHYRINAELAARFGERSAAFDGAIYHPHISVAIGGASRETYREILAERTDNPVAPHTFTTRELALFVYDYDQERGNWQYMTYRILPMGDRAK